jgi:N-acetyl-alpha-D-glucosaminyl L-malate synthase BshA
LRKEYAEPYEKVMIHISNFRPVKRVSDVVDVFAKVSERIPSRLVFVGEGPDLAKVVCQVKKLGLSDRVHFCGKQDDVAQLLSMADVMLLTSEKESFGLVALEAMACGVPTIGSNAGGIPELVTHGETGYLAPIGDTDQMAEFALRLLSDPVGYSIMSNACVHRARTVFCNDLITNQYEETYYRVLGRPMPESLRVNKNICLG